jgi:hypothetical protein
MKEFNIKELFCEIFSGFIAIIVFVLIIDCFDQFHFKDILNDLKLDFGFITSMIILSYFVGLIVDSIGLSLGELFLDKKVTKGPELTDEENKKFYNRASASNDLAYISHVNLCRCWKNNHSGSSLAKLGIQVVS